MSLLTQKDSLIFRGFFKEMAKLRGIPAVYKYAVTTDVAIHADFTSTYSKPYNIDIIFEENPKISTLKAIGWISEKPDDKPYIAMLPFDVPHLTAESRITIRPISGVSSRAREFAITSIQTIIEFPDCWTCTLAPVFDSAVPKTDYSNSDYNYVDSTETPLTDVDNNNYAFINFEDQQ